MRTICYTPFFLLFFFNDTATTEIYTLSLHDALPISRVCPCCTETKAASRAPSAAWRATTTASRTAGWASSCASTSASSRSEEHTSELQSQSNLVCRLLLEKKKQKYRTDRSHKRNSEE